MERNDKQIALLGTQHNLSGLGESNLSLESGQPESQDLVLSSFPFGTGYAQRVGQWGEASLAGINPCQQDANEWVYMHFLIELSPHPMRESLLFCLFYNGGT